MANIHIKPDIREIRVTDIKPFPGNPRDITAEALSGLRASLEKFSYIDLAVKRALLALPRQVASLLVGLKARQIEVLLLYRIQEIISLLDANEAIIIKDVLSNLSGVEMSIIASSGHKSAGELNLIVNWLNEQIELYKERRKFQDLRLAVKAYARFLAENLEKEDIFP